MASYPVNLVVTGRPVLVVGGGRIAAGKVLGVFAAARDVTKQVQAQRKIVEQQAMELDRLAELERFQRLTVGRELKMIELKKRIEVLERLIQPDEGLW